MKVTAEVTLTPSVIAEAFCGLNDEGQAQVFIEVAKLAATWDGRPGYQWWLVGRHLRNCECSTDEARDIVREIASAMDYDEPVQATR